MKVHKQRKLPYAYKVLGVPLSTKVNQYLSLMSVSKQITKACLVRNIIEEWMRKNSHLHSDILTDKIADQLYEEWKWKGTDVEQVLVEIEKKLGKKGLSDNQIKIIQNVFREKVKISKKKEIY